MLTYDGCVVVVALGRVQQAHDLQAAYRKLSKLDPADVSTVAHTLSALCCGGLCVHRVAVAVPALRSRCAGVMISPLLVWGLVDALSRGGCR